MAIRVVAAPTTLAWSLFTTADSLPEGEDAHTAMKYTIQNAQLNRASGSVSVKDATLIVTPTVRVLKGAKQTPDLLAHEQGHYNIGILIGRAMAREMEGATGSDTDALKTALNDILEKHSKTLMPPVQHLYDHEADGSRNAGGQGRWNAIIASALSSSTPVDTLSQLPL